MALTIAQVCDGIKTSFAGFAVGGTAVLLYSFDELPEMMHDTPAIEIYPESLDTDARTETDMTTLQKGVRNHAMVVRLDCYADRRNHLDENMAAVVAMWDAVQDKLEEVCVCPNFGIEQIRVVRMRSVRAVFSYENTSPPTQYSGIRYELDIEIF